MAPRKAHCRCCYCRSKARDRPRSLPAKQRNPFVEAFAFGFKLYFRVIFMMFAFCFALMLIALKGGRR